MLEEKMKLIEQVASQRKLYYNKVIEKDVCKEEYLNANLEKFYGLVRYQGSKSKTEGLGKDLDTFLLYIRGHNTLHKRRVLQMGEVETFGESKIFDPWRKDISRFWSIWENEAK